MRTRWRDVLRCAAAVVGLTAAAGLGTPYAAHAEPDDDKQIEYYDWELFRAANSPVLQSIRVEGDTVHFTFVDRSEVEGEYTFVAWPHPNELAYKSTSRPRVPGKGRVVNGTVSGLPSGVEICGNVSTEVEWDGAYRRAESNRVCYNPETAPPDLALQTIRGPADRPAHAGGASYILELRNVGANDASGVVVDVSTSGVAELGDQSVIRQTWANNGFTCTVNSPTNMRCTGGNVPKGTKIEPWVMTTYKGPGQAWVHAQVSGAGDNTPGNNGTAFHTNVT
ncbi:MAG: hypothetical protein DIU75_003250 [Mycolicibacterium hassiacum]|jgi:hypothetical protein|uniref:hypothetical protein n=1 Tax=Mycolicibacterium hassiacum TaxID=46351 RepID=UPI000DB5B192|nr:hypothetical protein [Mycolicibacterium hassiacum]MBX5489240.1 hypothetical protein [Mycolicibacterium hassiacum]PZN21961.1 MAG: hypothetical protein DIU75_08890 [Mycolicibacterium hassiacum]